MLVQEICNKDGDTEREREGERERGERGEREEREREWERGRLIDLYLQPLQSCI